jgi:murein L,D-transpeptidase YafK
MTAARMVKAAGNPNQTFWKNLAEGYDRFEQNQIPPHVTVRQGRYQF